METPFGEKSTVMKHEESGKSHMDRKTKNQTSEGDEWVDLGVASNSRN